MGGEHSRQKDSAASAVPFRRSYAMGSVADEIPPDAEHPPPERKRTNTIHRVSSCPKAHKCPSVKNIRKKNIHTESDLRHLSDQSHPRFKCRNGTDCVHFNRLKSGGYLLEDRCHAAVFVHAQTRFVADFDDERTRGSLNLSHTQLSAPGGAHGTEYRRVGVMVCDGTCGSKVTRGLWKCWQFRDLIWPSLENESATVESFTSMAHQMIQSVVALAGEDFLTQLHETMQSAEPDTARDINRRASDGREVYQTGENYGKLLREFSNRALSEMEVTPDDFPRFNSRKSWHNSDVYGILLGMSNVHLKLRAHQAPTMVHGKKRKRRSRNLRHEVFIAGCKYASRDLFSELAANGFDQVMNIDAVSYRVPSSRSREMSTTDVSPEWTSLQDVAVSKLEHERHIAMGSPLEEEELLAVLLFTGTSVGYDVVSSHRKYRNYCKWRVLQNRLISAIRKLHRHDRQSLPNQLFHGLKKKRNSGNSNGDESSNSNPRSNDLYLFNTFVSTTSDHRVIESQFSSHDDGALLFLSRNDSIICADVSWISKFDHEHEVLFAPCALTVTNPFATKENKSSDIQKRKSSRRVRGDRVELATQSSNPKPAKPKRKHKSSNRRRGSRDDSTADENASHRSTPSLVNISSQSLDLLRSNMNFSLVDGKLENYSMSGSVFNPFHGLLAGDDEDEVDFKAEMNPDAPIGAPKLSLADTNFSDDTAGQPNVVGGPGVHILADFLYGKSDEEALWAHIGTDRGFIEVSELQQLFLSLFLFAVQIECSNPNMRSYSMDFGNLAAEYASTFAGNVMTMSTNTSTSGRITKEYFISHANELHDLYEQFVNELLERAQVGSARTDVSALGGISFSDSNEYGYVAGVGGNINMGSPITVSGAKLVADVEIVRAFCISSVDLEALWSHFAKENADSGMTHAQFDGIIYCALAFFVSERNPDAPLAARATLEPLIEDLRTSLLSAYDAKNTGIVTYEGFRQFGDYLRHEYRKLRGSLSSPQNVDTEPGYADEFNENDLSLDERDALEEIAMFGEDAKQLLTEIETSLETMHSPGSSTATSRKMMEIQEMFQNVTFLTKEMEIRVNLLNSNGQNSNLKYENAQRVHEVDVTREYLQHTFDTVFGQQKGTTGGGDTLAVGGGTRV